MKSIGSGHADELSIEIIRRKSRFHFKIDRWFRLFNGTFCPLIKKVTNILFQWRYQIDRTNFDENNDEQWLIYEWMNKLIWYFHFNDCSSILQWKKPRRSLSEWMERNCNIMKMNCGLISTSITASIGRCKLKEQKQCQRTMCYFLVQCTVHTNVVKKLILNPLKLRNECHSSG